MASVKMIIDALEIKDQRLALVMSSILTALRAYPGGYASDIDEVQKKLHLSDKEFNRGLDALLSYEIIEEYSIIVGQEDRSGRLQ